MLDLQSFLLIRRWPWFVLQVTLILLLCACIICSSHLEEPLQQSKFTVSCQIHFLQESPLLSWPTVAHFGLPFSFFSLYMDVKMTSLWCLLWSIDSRFWGYGKGPWEKVPALGIAWKVVFALSCTFLTPWEVFWPHCLRDSLSTSSCTFASFKISNKCQAHGRYPISIS